MASKNQNHDEVLKWAQSKVNELKRDEKKNKKRYSIIAIAMAFVNVAIVTLASIGLAILIKYSNELKDAVFALVMASIAASLTIIIFFVNMINIIYRSLMKWHAYKDGADAIQHEVIRFHLHDDYKKYKNPEEHFINKIGDIYEKAIHTKRHKNPWKLMLKALAGGDNV